MFEVIPAIDLLDGKVVRLTQGDYAQVTPYDQLTPAEWAKKMEDSGATRLHIVDLNGAKSGSMVNLSAIESIRNACKAKIDLGGGIRSLETAKKLRDLGIDFLVLGSMLTKNMPLATEIINAFPEQIIAGLDAKDTDLAVEGWIENSGISILTMIEKLNAFPLHAIIYTDISKDGMMAGPNLNSLAEVATISKHPIIASGGISSLQDIKDVQFLSPQGINGCIVGKAILSGKISVENALKYNL